ncbi:hypothetical protein Pfo_010829 [Paulownia fortunei]|nr:hypothetical protein Pfo_010829 [Paulownia fortunei]
MSSEVESTKRDDEDFSCGLLLRDIEEISKALYLHKSPHKPFNSSYDHRPNVVAKTGISESKSTVIIQDSLHKDKKSSLWNWKPLKALTHIRNHRFNCCFFLHVHAIEGLPPNFNNLNLCVTWKRKADMLRTCPARVCLGMAEFEETLMHRCTVYGSRTGPHSSAKYEPKLFLLHASVIGAPELDIGNHWIDLSRLLPLTLEELEGDKSSSGKWTTSFKLTGKAKGAMLNVSFGFSILGGNSFEPGYFVKVPDIVGEGGLNHFADFDMSSRTSQLHNLGSVPRISTEGSYRHSQSANVNFLDEIFPKQGSELSHSVTLLYRKLDEGKMGNVMDLDLYHKHLESLKPMSDPSPESAGGKTGHEFNDTEFDVIEQGIEVSTKDQMKIEKCGSQRFDSSVVETIDVAEIFKGEETAFHEYVEWNSKLDTDNQDEHECATGDPEHIDNSTCIIEPALEELDSAFNDMLTSKPAELDSLLDINKYYEQENYKKARSSYKAERLTKSLSLDDVAESIENDFLNMLSIDQSQDDIVSGSGHDPPGDLLRLFEVDTLPRGNPILDTDLMAEQRESCCFTPSGYRKVAFADDYDLSFAIQAVERNHGSVNQSLRSKRNAKVLENLETEALMHEWGLTEKAFQNSPRASSGGFGSPVYLPAEEPLKLPSIEEGVGPIIWTKDGGFLRSMNPLLFTNASNDARLIVQVSAPVVLPSAMGFTIMEILQYWASGGVDKMCIQVNELMRLEDVTGKTIQQVFSEAESGSNAFNRWALQRESDVGAKSFVEKKPNEYLPSVQSSETCPNSEQIESDYVSFENLVPMAITNIEGLLVEGLKIQSGMPDQEAPSSIRIQLAGNSASLGKGAEHSSNFSSESVSGLQVLDVDELMKCSLSLEEWLRLDSGEFCVEDETDEYILKLFAAHCAKPIELGSGWPTREDESVKLLGRSCGVFGNNFRMGLKVQLRDPLRNYEMVGSSMLALIQVDRVYSAPQPELHRLSSEKICNQQEDGLNEHMILEGIDFEQNEKKICEPLFKFSEVHLAGLNVIHGNKQLWGTSRQQQSGSRWLLSSGMAKSNKNLISNSNAAIKSSSGLMRKARPGDVLWSISSPIQGEAATWDEQVALNVHVRNPDIIFPTESASDHEKQNKHIN